MELKKTQIARIGIFSFKEDTKLQNFLISLEKLNESYFEPFKVMLKNFRIVPSIKSILPYSMTVEQEFNLFAISAARYDCKEQNLYSYSGIEEGQIKLINIPEFPFTLRSYSKNFQVLQTQAQIRPLSICQSKDDMARAIEGMGMELSHVIFKDGIKVRSQSGLETYIYSLYSNTKNYEEGIRFKPTLSLKEEDLQTKADNVLTTCFCVEVKAYAEGQEQEQARVDEIVEYSQKLKEFLILEKGMR